MKVRESNIKNLAFKGLQGDLLSFKKGKKCGYTSLNMDKYVCHVKSLLEWQNATILLNRRRIRE